MAIQVDAITPSTTAADSDFDLDVSIVESGLVVAELMRNTDDECGKTCESACLSCP
ncbi:MAG: FxLD family lantipeptide [Pseudonocardiaceae bacterium]|nr:FxLD family lantipeptide [Pseudonocardiaceae bacterium]